MSYKLTIIFFLLITACVNTDKLDDLKLGNTEINFLPRSLQEGSTRSISEIASNLKDVSAYHHTILLEGGKKISTPTYHEVFKQTQLSYQNENWTYSPMQYWDVQATYQFTAFSPNLRSGVELTDHQLRLNQIDLTQEMYRQKDLLYAAPIPVDGSQKGSVNLTFKHILSKVNVIVRKGNAHGSDYKVQLDEVTLAGMYREASFDSDANDRWNSYQHTHQVKYTGPMDIPTTGFYAINGSLLFPQEIQQGMYLEIKYTTSDQPQQTARINLYDKTYNKAWGEGQNINYQVVIGKQGIQFERPIIKGWDEKMHYIDIE